MKRARTSGRSLTGGTGDVKPQIMTLNTPLNTPGQYIVTRFPLPVSRFGTRKNLTTVIEILKVWWYDGIEDMDDTNTISISYLTTSVIQTTGGAVGVNTMADDAEDPSTLAMYIHQSYTVGVSTGASNRAWPSAEMDMTDGAGNGILIATDGLFIVFGNRTATAASKCTAKILYRFTNVSVEEYVGIVQSQQ